MLPVNRRKKMNIRIKVKYFNLKASPQYFIFHESSVGFALNIFIIKYNWENKHLGLEILTTYWKTFSIMEKRD